MESTCKYSVSNLNEVVFANLPIEVKIAIKESGRPTTSKSRILKENLKTVSYTHLDVYKRQHNTVCVCVCVRVCACADTRNLLQRKVFMNPYNPFSFNISISGNISGSLVL